MHCVHYAPTRLPCAALPHAPTPLYTHKHTLTCFFRALCLSAPTTLSCSSATFISSLRSATRSRAADSWGVGSEGAAGKGRRG